MDVAAPRDHANDGQHVVGYCSVDVAGNVEPTRVVTVKIDTTPPGFSWRAAAVAPSEITSTRSVSFRFTIREPSGAVDVVWRVADQYGYPAGKHAAVERDPGQRAVDVVPRYANGSAFMPGLYKVTLTLTDQAGNTTVSSPRAFRDYRPERAGVWRHVSGAGRRVALTFDDGGAGPWASMLKTLRNYRMHATFFVLGPYVSASPALARRTLAWGDAIGSHGWTHTDMTRQGYGGVREELLHSESPWWWAAGATPAPYCRPPYGSYDSTTIAAAGSAGFTRVIIWDVDPRDWTEPGSGAIAARVLSHVHSGAIVCMHLRGQTAAALPAILRGLRARHYRCVSLPELFRAAGYR